MEWVDRRPKWMAERVATSFGHRSGDSLIGTRRASSLGEGELVGGHRRTGAAGRGDVDAVGPRRLGRGDGGDLGVETTVKLVAATVPKSTLVAPVKPVPVMVTVVPPASGPRSARWR